MKHLDNLTLEDTTWLIRVRFYVLLIQYPLSLVGYHFGYLGFSTILLFLSLNTLFLGYNYWLSKSSVTPRLELQLMMDVLVFTLLLSISGGPSNPFNVFFHFFAVLGGIFAVGKKGMLYLFFLLTCILWTHLFFNFHVYNFRPSAHLLINLFIQLLVSMIIFSISSYLGFLLRQHQRNAIQLALQNAKLDRLRALGSLSAGFSHEFASPLNTIKLRLNRLMKKSDQFNEDIEEARQAASDCEEILRKMNASQFDHRAVEMVVVPIDKAIQQVLSNWKESNQDQQIRVHPIESSLLIKVPLINFAQSLLNLLDNAQEACPNAGKIEISVTNTPRSIVLTVKDEGEGFSPEVLKHLGEPFNTSKTSGTGLGLYSVMLFMDSVLGSCVVGNNPEGKGAFVSLNFPKVLNE